ncbi:MAG: membrane protein insertion efficiency factor YidD [Clostridia bacterium]|nr:membrane protein insertion efficiency factor YidD [Clostridia bacterium]
MNQTEHKEIIKEYQKQREMEEYQRSRALDIPKTTYAHVIIWSILYIIIIVGFCVFSLFVYLPFALKVLTIPAVVLIFSDYYFRFLGKKAVECYQHYAKEETRRRCLCIPSCSEYAILCFKKYELIKALTKIRRRLYVTCRGDDYKIDLP